SVLLVLDQTKNLLGLKAVGDAHAHFLVRFWRTITEGGTVHSTTLLIGVAAIALILALRWLKALIGWRLLPEFLIVVIVMAVVTAQLGLAEQGVAVGRGIPPPLPTATPPEP